MGRRRKKKKNSQKKAVSNKLKAAQNPVPETTPNDSGEQQVEKKIEPAASASASTAETKSEAKATISSVAPDAPWESWPPLQDRGQNPVRLPYDHGGIPLPLLLFYMSFLAFAMTYMANWLVPDLLNYFFTE